MSRYLFVFLFAGVVIAAFFICGLSMFLFWRKNCVGKSWRQNILKYLRKYAKRNVSDINSPNCSIPENYLDVLETYCEITRNVEVDGKYYELEFSTANNVNPRTLNADAGMDRIIVSQLWAAKIVFDGSEDTINAFKITLGHELSHKDEICPFKIEPLCWRFFKILNEVCADFGGAEKMANKSRTALERSCRYKRDFKIKTGRADKWGYGHPSWQKREEYAHNFDFNDELIEKVAHDMPFNWFVLHCGCVEKAKRIYREKYITLSPKI